MRFGPRMLANFIRDRITQFTLGTFVVTFVFAILALVSIGPDSHGDFVPHVSITMTMALVVVDVVALVVFLDHIAKSIQSLQVIASIAGDLSRAARGAARAGGDDPARERGVGAGGSGPRRRAAAIRGSAERCR